MRYCVDDLLCTMHDASHKRLLILFTNKINCYKFCFFNHLCLSLSLTTGLIILWFHFEYKLFYWWRLIHVLNARDFILINSRHFDFDVNSPIKCCSQIDCIQFDEMITLKQFHEKENKIKVKIRRIIEIEAKMKWNGVLNEWMHCYIQFVFLSIRIYIFLMLIFHELK